MLQSCYYIASEFFGEAKLVYYVVTVIS